MWLYSVSGMRSVEEIDPFAVIDGRVEKEITKNKKNECLEPAPWKREHEPASGEITSNFAYLSI